MENALRRVLHGQTTFVSDRYHPRMLYVHTLRSQISRGRLVDLEPGTLPEGIRLLRAADIPGRNAMNVMGDEMPILAEDRVEYFGQPIGLLVGPDLDRLIRLAGTISADYEEETPVLEDEDPGDDSIYAMRTRSWGDSAKAMKDAARIVESSYRTGAQAHLYSEPQGVFVIPEDDGLLVYSPSQWPHHVQKTICGVCRMPAERVSVRKAELAMTLDGKLIMPSLVAAHGCLAATVTGRPVKMMYSREEDFLYTPKRAPVRVRHRTGLDARGRPVAMEVSVDINLGAFPLFVQETLTRLCVTATGVYDCDHVTVRARAVRTNLPPLGAFSGFGSSSTLFAAETHMARIAEILETDPVAYKLTHLASETVFTVPTRSRKEHSLREVASSLVTDSDFNRKFAAYELARKRRRDFDVGPALPRGIGFALSYQGSGLVGNGEAKTGYGVRMRLDTSGRAEIRTSAVATTPSTTTMWKRVAASVLGISADDVDIHEVDTAEVPDSGPSTLSRNISIVNRLIESCANSIKKQRFRKPLPIEVRRSFQLPRSLTWDDESLLGVPFANVTWGGAVVEVEADPVSFRPRVRGIWIVIDAGRIVERRQILRAVETSTMVSLGWASSEHLEHSEGRLTPKQYETYRVLNIGDRPPLHVSFLQAPDKADPKGVGEIAGGCVPAAFALAVSQATGQYVDRLPATPEVIHSYLEAQ